MNFFFFLSIKPSPQVSIQHYVAKVSDTKSIDKVKLIHVSIVMCHVVSTPIHFMTISEYTVSSFTMVKDSL